MTAFTNQIFICYGMHSQCMCGHVYAEGVCLLPQDCYKTVVLDNAKIINGHCCSLIPACVHFTRRARKFIQGCKQAVSSQCLQNYSQWQHSILAWFRLGCKGNISHLSTTKTANISGIVYL